MKRESHTVYGATAGYLVAGLPGALLGGLVASLPDDMEQPLSLEHRKSSHSVFAVILVAGCAGWVCGVAGIDHRYAQAVAAGYLSHLLVDSMTISGIYWLSPFQRKNKFHLLPRAIRVRTGSSMDSLLAGIVGVWLCWMVIPEVWRLVSVLDVESLIFW